MKIRTIVELSKSVRALQAVFPRDDVHYNTVLAHKKAYRELFRKLNKDASARETLRKALDAHYHALNELAEETV